MPRRKPQQKIGTAYRISGRFTFDEGNKLVLDQGILKGLSGAMSALVDAGIMMTASPDWRTVCLYSEGRWDELSSQLRCLDSRDPEARRIQRVMLGYATPCLGDDELMVEPGLTNYAHLGEELILLVFGVDSAELWSEAELARIADLELL